MEDMVSLGGEDADEEAFPLRFGCQDDITGLFENQIPDGIFGMNKEKGSAISQWSKLGYLDASAFSLCYNVREDVKEKSGVMMLGGSDERLHEKPMVFAKDIGEKNYELRIKEIRMQRGAALSTGAGVNTVANLGLDGTDTAVLDSGSTCTYLNREWKEPLEEAWRQMTGGKYSMFSHLSIADDKLDELPTILFEVEGTKENETVVIRYPPIRYMEKSESGDGWGFCLYASDRSVTLGNTFMAGHDVLHDLDNKRIGFAESTCQPSIVQPSAEEDADKTRTLPPMSITSDAPPAPPVTNLKPMVLQSEPVHKRQPVDSTSPGVDFLYAVVALVVVVLAIVLLRRFRGKTVSWWSEPSTKHAYQLSWISLVLTALAIIAGIALFSVGLVLKRHCQSSLPWFSIILTCYVLVLEYPFQTTGSSLFLVLALENCVDFLSSAVVLWRFFAPSGVTEQLEVELKGREEHASRAINMILVVLGVGIWITAIQDLLRGQEETSSQEQRTALIISFCSLVIFGFLTAVKFRYAKVLDSPSLYKDGICSMIGTTLSASLFIDTLIIKGAASAWWIDPVVAIGCGFVSFGYGIKALYKAKYEMKEDMPRQKSVTETEAHDEHHIFT